MLRTTLPSLLFVLVPCVGLAQQVELRSADEFISVEGEITGFNGVMLSVQTSVGQVSVPASEVICYGAACLDAIANPAFGLTAASFDGVEASEPPVVAEVASDDFVISFDASPQNMIYSRIAGGFIVAGGDASASLDDQGQLFLQNDAGNQTATISLAQAGDASELRVRTVPLRGTATAAFSGPVGWATATQLTHQQVALDAFAVIAAPNVGVDTVSVSQLAGIYAGDLTNWSQLGGADLTILPLQLPQDAALRNDKIAFIMEPEDKSIAANVLTLADETALALSVDQLPGSISVVSLAGAANSETLSVSGSCEVAVPPTPFYIASGDYPLIRPTMVIYDRAPNTALPTALFDFAASDTAQQLLVADGLSAVGGVVQDSAEKNARLSTVLNGSFEAVERPVAAQMFQTLFEAARLSPTLTGGPASAAEGALNRAMMQDLADMLRTPESANRELIFAGFATSDSGPEEAISASEQAAADVLSAFAEFAPDVVEAGNLTLSSYGFGGVSPATCYEGQVPGPTHTRVEAWLR